MAEYGLGANVFGQWQITKKIGEGSFGKVYEIRREDFGQLYRAALKVITVPQSRAELLEKGMDNATAERYYYTVVEDIVREFALMSRLKGSANIVAYEDHNIIKHENDVGFDILIKMELLKPIQEYSYENPLKRRDVIRLGIDLCNALELCQRFNIIHRDIKPDNIFISELGNFKLGDFGIARTVEKTMSGLSKKGTYNYMAPEVYKGDAYGHSVDIYSLGIVMYRLLNKNRLPFLPPTPEPITFSDEERAKALRMSGEVFPKPVDATGRLFEIITKATAYKSTDRYSSPIHMREELQAILYSEKDSDIIYPNGDEIRLSENIYATNNTSENPQSKSPDENSKNNLDPEATISVHEQQPQKQQNSKATVSVFEQPGAGDNKASRTVCAFELKTTTSPEKTPPVSPQPYPINKNNREPLNNTVVVKDKRKSKVPIFILAGVLVLIVAVSVIYSLSSSEPIETTTSDGITFNSAVLEDEIREIINKPVGDILQSDLDSITELDLSDKGLIDFPDIYKLNNLTTLNLSNNEIAELSYAALLIASEDWTAENLTEIDISNNKISDLTIFSYMPALTTLNITGNKVSDLTPIADMTGLITLKAGSNMITDLTPIAGLIGLRELDLSNASNAYISSLSYPGGLAEFIKLLMIVGDTPISLTYESLEGTLLTEAQRQQLEKIHLMLLGIGDVNSINDLIPLAGMKNLTVLNLSGNVIKGGLAPISNLTMLEELILGRSGVIDITPIANLSNLKSLDISQSGVTDLTAIENLTQITSLDISYNGIENIAPVSGFSNLVELNISGIPVSDLSPIAGMAQLTALSVSNSGITDLGVLSAMSQLKALDISHNQIGDYNPLSALTSLTTLKMSGTTENLTPIASLTGLTALEVGYITELDLTPIAGLTELTILNIENSSTTNLAPISALTELIYLNIAGNELTDLIPLIELKELRFLNATNNSINGLTPLVGLTELLYLNVSINEISDLSPLSGITKLNELHVADNKISNLYPLESLTELTFLDIGDNQIVDLKPIKTMEKLEMLGAYNNEISDLTPLDSLRGMKMLDVKNNQIIDIEPLSLMTDLKILDISNNQITNLYATDLMRLLEILYIDNNRITDISILSDLPNLDTVSLGENNIIDYSPVDHVDYVSGRP